MTEETEQIKSPKNGPRKIHNAQEFGNYVHAVTIPMKIAMGAIVIFFMGIIAFCIFGTVPIYTSAVAVSDSSTCTCYVKAEDRNGIDLGDQVILESKTYSIASISSQASCIDDTFDEYALQVGDLRVGDYVYLVEISGDVSEGVYTAQILKDYMQPLSALMNM